jgi:hypothetical protein
MALTPLISVRLESRSGVFRPCDFRKRRVRHSLPHSAALNMVTSTSVLTSKDERPTPLPSACGDSRGSVARIRLNKAEWDRLGGSIAVTFTTGHRCISDRNVRIIKPGKEESWKD